MSDLFSRQVAIEAFEDCFGNLHIEDACKEVIEKLPSAQPDCSDCIQHGGDWECDRVHCRKGKPERKGKWIKWNGMDIPENHGRHKCSQCGEFAPIVYEKPLKKERLTNFCPNCGSCNEGE